MDEKGSARTGVMVNIARGANADAFAKHWHTVARVRLYRRRTVRYTPFQAGPAASMRHREWQLAR
jgi:hypothetical protein